MTSTENIQKCISRIYNPALKNGPHRSKAWEYCYRYFCDNRDGLRVYLNECGQVPTVPMLQLATYLANWGMYRGSGFLLKSDYTIFDGVVAELLKHDYDILWAKDNDINNIIASDGQRTEFTEKLIRVKERIKEIWSGRAVSDLLITKILMATYGCVPAYDRFVRKGMESEKICKTFGKKSINELLDFYSRARDGFDTELSLHIGGGKYPIMRKMDMYLFVKGGALNQK